MLAAGGGAPRQIVIPPIFVWMICAAAAEAGAESSCMKQWHWSSCNQELRWKLLIRKLLSFLWRQDYLKLNPPSLSDCFRHTACTLIFKSIMKPKTLNWVVWKVNCWILKMMFIRMMRLLFVFWSNLPSCNMQHPLTVLYAVCRWAVDPSPPLAQVWRMHQVISVSYQQHSAVKMWTH